MKKGLFVTATSTEIGKTIVASMIVRRLAEAYNRLLYYKPVQSGCIIDESGKMISPDCRFVETVMNGLPGFKTSYSYMLKRPASPHYSARFEDINIEIKKIYSDYRNFMNDFDFIVTEGAGGLYVPLDENGRLMADIPTKLGINSIIVASAGLGTINHVSLSYKFALSKKIKTAAIILISREETPDDLEEENARILKKLLNFKNIYMIPPVKSADTENNLAGDILEKIKFFPDTETIKGWIYE